MSTSNVRRDRVSPGKRGASAHAAPRRGGRRLTALGLSLAVHGTLFAGLSLWSVAAFGGRHEVRSARLELAQARAQVPVVAPEPVHEVVLAEPLDAADPPEPVAVDPLGPRETLPDAPVPQTPLEDLAPLAAPQLPLAPLVPAARDEPVPPADASDVAVALDEPASAEVEPPDAAGQDEEREPVLIDAPKPRYPPIALSRGWEGVVVLRLWVAVDGSVADVAIEASSGFAVFDDAALTALRRWRFEPGRQRTVDVLHSVRFDLVAE